MRTEPRQDVRGAADLAELGCRRGFDGISATRLDPSA